MKTYELPCMDRCKSFYGKAKVIEHDDGTRELQSYNTIVCRLTPDNHFVRLWAGYSVTTMRHVNSFLVFMGFNQYGGKAFWDSADPGEMIAL